MRSSVRDAWFRHNAPLEGVTTWPYLDVKGLVTVGVGNLIDPIAAALNLRWVKPDGSDATQAEIAAEWNLVKSRQDLKLRGGGAFKTLTTLRLPDTEVMKLVNSTLGRADRAMAARFQDWEQWPADAQLATLSMCWAVGPGWPLKFPNCAKALDQREFLVAATECKLREEGNPGVRPRNRNNQVLYRNASVVQASHLDPETLFFPRDIWEVPLGPDDDTLDEDTVTPVVDFKIVHPWVFREPDDDEGPDDAA